MKFKNKNLVNLKGEKIDLKILSNQISEDIKETKFLLDMMRQAQNELTEIRSELRLCTDIREYRVIEAHLNNTMKQLDDYNARYDKVIARCERREKIIK